MRSFLPLGFDKSIEDISRSSVGYEGMMKQLTNISKVIPQTIRYLVN